MIQMNLFPNFGIAEDERLYVIGNGFDIHHNIESKYSDFKKWVFKNLNSNLIRMMDIFFSNKRDFWYDIENALGDYTEEGITDYCEPVCSNDFKYDHPGQWQAGVEDSISTIFGNVMSEFRDAFIDWVKSINLNGIETDLFLPTTSKYLTFNYTETLEKCYNVPKSNVLHIHGCRLEDNCELVIGHNNFRDAKYPLGDEHLLLPYQNANSEVIDIMNGWFKDAKKIITSNRMFFTGLTNCRAVCVMGLSYNDIDMPYLMEVAINVADDCKWWLYYYDNDDKGRAEKAAKVLKLHDCKLVQFE